MAFLAKGKKEDLRTLAFEMDIQVNADMKIVELKKLICESPSYEEVFVKELLAAIIEDRKLKEETERQREEKEREMAFQLEKLRLEAQNESVSRKETIVSSDVEHRVELGKIITKFDPKEDDIGLFLNLFEKQMKFFEIPDVKWVPYLIGQLPSDVAKLIARESDENAKCYAYVRSMLLKRFKMTAEKFRQQFFERKKSSDVTWREFH